MWSGRCVGGGGSACVAEFAQLWTRQGVAYKCLLCRDMWCPKSIYLTSGKLTQVCDSGL